MNITFFKGSPNNELLPNEEILKAYTAVLGEKHETDNDEENRHPLTYGSDEGAYIVRKEISDWINRRNRNPNTKCTPECINLTNGASFGAATALIQCCPPSYTKLAFATSPTYFLINQVLTDHGFTGRMRAVCETESGIDLNGFESQLKEYPVESKKWFRYVLYLVPIYSNPGGYKVTKHETDRLLAIARKYNVLLLCDHVYDYLNYGDKETEYIETLVAADRATLPDGSLGNVIANYSFSKYLGPGLRVGWQECATPELAYYLSQSGQVRSGGTPSHLNTFVAKELIRSGDADKILENLNKEYGIRSKAYKEAMETYLPKNTKILGGNGGYFFWVTLPEEYDTDAITAKCDEKGIVLAQGHHFEVEGDEKGWGKSSFRVSLSYHNSEDATAAIKVWGEVCSECKRS